MIVELYGFYNGSYNVSIYSIEIEKDIMKIQIIGNFETVGY